MDGVKWTGEGKKGAPYYYWRVAGLMSATPLRGVETAENKVGAGSDPDGGFIPAVSTPGEGDR